MSSAKKKNQFSPKKSVDWYDPRQLSKTGIKVLISSIFGNFSDKREAQAFQHNDDPDEKKCLCEFADKDELWLDYVADTGDGFNATFTMAKLLAKEELTSQGVTTKRGQILIMGGDQVYPVSSREEYNSRLQGPYECALPLDKEDENAPQLFAIPGNHDWYDGLTNFMKVFGQKRTIGNWRTKQTRSYFALKLPHNVWLFGIDVQLNSDIDYNQTKYFKRIMNTEMDKEVENKIILCTAEPSWIFHTSKDSESYNNLRFFEERIVEEAGSHQVITLAGDLHHYARYEDEHGCQKITAGGGGAFMHPTHHLPEEIGDLREEKIKLKKVYPSAKVSKYMILKNMSFAFSSWRFSLMFGGIYFLFSALSRPLDSGFEDFDVFSSLLNPSAILIAFVIGIGLYSFMENKPSNPKFESTKVYNAFGALHGVVQVAFIILSYWAIVKSVSAYNPIPGLAGDKLLTSQIYSWFVIQGAMFVLGSLIGGSVFGLYLILSNLFLGNHDNEAYSSLRWSGYKNFIRIHITEDQITIFPYGVQKALRWKEKRDDDSPVQTFKAKGEIDYRLIENPIKIDLKRKRKN